MLDARACSLPWPPGDQGVCGVGAVGPGGGHSGGGQRLASRGLHAAGQVSWGVHHGRALASCLRPLVPCPHVAAPGCWGGARCCCGPGRWCEVAPCGATQAPGQGRGAGQEGAGGGSCCNAEAAGGQQGARRRCCCCGAALGCASSRSAPAAVICQGADCMALPLLLCRARRGPRSTRRTWKRLLRTTPQWLRTP